MIVQLVFQKGHIYRMRPKSALDIAENNLNTAQQEYEDGVTTNGARDVLNAERMLK